MAKIMQIILHYAWRLNPTKIYIRVNKDFEFSLTLRSSGIYEQCFYSNIGRISPRLGGSRDGCMIVCEM